MTRSAQTCSRKCARRRDSISSARCGSEGLTLMATVEPFEGTRYNPEHVKLGGVLAPPYDVITDAQREQLYGRDLRNIVRVDYGISYPNDVDGVDDRYTRASSFLASWRDLGVLVRDATPSFYVVDHHFQHPDGTQRRRR